jgi:hypothetical protein
LPDQRLSSRFDVLHVLKVAARLTFGEGGLQRFALFANWYSSSPCGCRERGEVGTVAITTSALGRQGSAMTTVVMAFRVACKEITLRLRGGDFAQILQHDFREYSAQSEGRQFACRFFRIQNPELDDPVAFRLYATPHPEGYLHDTWRSFAQCQENAG